MLTPVAAQAILVPRNAARRIKVILKSCFLEEIAPTEKRWEFFQPANSNCGL
jgi:hypothetical protein